MRQIHPDATLTLLDPPEGPAGKGLAATDVSMETRGFAMSSLSKHKKEVMILLDFLASPEGQMMEQMGFENTHYVRKGNTINVTPKLMPGIRGLSVPPTGSRRWSGGRLRCCAISTIHNVILRRITPLSSGVVCRRHRLNQQYL